MSESPASQSIRSEATARSARRLNSTVWVQRIVGVLWIIDGLLQIQPQMFTMNMINGMMTPLSQGQPAPIAANLNWWIAFITTNLAAVNWGIAVLQVTLGLCFVTGRWMKAATIISVVWAIAVWYVGEGLSLLLTGQSSVLTGAPGSVVFYALLALIFFADWTAPDEGREAPRERPQIRWALASFWILAALLQLQPHWWQPQQISNVISGLSSPGTLSGLVLDPSLHWAASATSGIEVPLNLALVGIFLVLGLGLFFAPPAQSKPWLIATIALSLVIWWFCQGLGMVLTGMATDPNSGPLLVLLAVACWAMVPNAWGERTT